MELLAPIVAVTVHPERARITRRGRATVGAGAAELVVADLPTTLLDESVRVAGRSAAAARVLGVDVRWRDLAQVPDDRVRAAEGTVRDARRALSAIDGQDAADVAREQLLARLARRSGDKLAAALADGRAVDRVSSHSGQSSPVRCTTIPYQARSTEPVVPSAAPRRAS